MAKIDEPVGAQEEVAQTEQAARQAELAVPAEIAADSVGDYFRSSIAQDQGRREPGSCPSSRG